ncbi:MAG: alpha-2-macroglobulin family protein, partial [Zoogloeaceae bacterium]|nr:alpha-2-macroglobulin family protein [Zoogloeaceae bacterium]
GVANTLSYLWSNAWNSSRSLWRDLFSRQAKHSVTATVPALGTRTVSPQYRPTTPFKPLEGFTLTHSFRYPLMAAAPATPPQDVSMQGSSSDFMPRNDYNFYVPLGKLPPGLYIAEAILGEHRALTLVFISDTVAITKMASGTLTVWTAARDKGIPVADAKLQWTDGRGVLASATTDANGLATLRHTSPEHTYLLGEDASGGVFVSENFYYDSEIYDTKLYAVTDRPLYQPGDWVRLKFFGRHYRSANESTRAAAAPLDVEVLDPNGTPVGGEALRLAPEKGADMAFRLPDDAVAGGYDIRIKYQEKRYSAAFRVAEYVKPHFDITLIPDRPHFKTGEEIGGTIRLAYPDGKPVGNVTVDLKLRAQTLTMVSGELRYGGLFPVEVNTSALTTDDKGEARFSLPPVKEPSRLIFSFLATDGAAYRVRKSQELLVERAAASWRLVSERRFSAPGERTSFTLTAEEESAPPPASWEIIRLEDQHKTSGKFSAPLKPGEKWQPELAQSGSYSLLLRDAAGNIVAADMHWVSGDGVAVTPGAIEMVANKERYQPGETAEVLITFSEPVEEALLTLERDNVEASALLSLAAQKGASWISAERLSPKQWRARIPVTEKHAPNTTLSLVYVKDGEYVFQNQGLVVAVEQLELNIASRRKVALPGETVTVDVTATLRGKGVPALLVVSVVDEMIYALQPEIAPNMVEFFQHVRRNNVRTGASLNFITYDEATRYAQGATRQPPARHQYNERGIKLAERARRDDTDTAAWLPELVTNAQGKASFSFKMPDALSRWRITVRAVALNPSEKSGVYGQGVSFLHSDKSLYAKWTSPNWLRAGDTPEAAIAIFNNGKESRPVSALLTVAGKTLTQEAKLKRGVNYLVFKLPEFSGAQTARVVVREEKQEVDALEVPLTVESAAWQSVEEQRLALDGQPEIALSLPADAKNLRLSFAQNGSEHFLRIADSLIEYPWGCAEQTASRLIPLAIVTPLLTTDKSSGKSGRLWQALYSQRLRLAALAGPNATFGWWSNAESPSLFFSAYAYYADWHATRALGIQLPAEHWERLLLQEHYGAEHVLPRTLSLWFMQQIGLPVRTLLEGALKDNEDAKEDDLYQQAAQKDLTTSPILGEQETALSQAYARVLLLLMAKEAGLPPNARLNGQIDAAVRLLRESGHPSARALLLLAGKEDPSAAPEILAAVREHTPTIDRALTLVWTQKALGGLAAAVPSQLAPQGDWQKGAANLFGQSEWRWPKSAALPKELRLNAAATGVTAVLRYDTAEKAATRKNADALGTIERRLYRLEKQEEGGFAAVPLQEGEAISTQSLYLDEIVLMDLASEMRHGLLEVPLPPGAAIEPSTWGLMVDGEAMEKSRAEIQRDRYGVPLDSLQKEDSAVIRHLLRFAQKGRFVLPPARYYAMYQPNKKTFENGKTTWTVK